MSRRRPSAGTFVASVLFFLVILGPVAGAGALTAQPSPSSRASSPSQADDTPFVIEQIDSGSFPMVRAIVSGPSIDGDGDDTFVVSEDGEPLTVDVVQLRGGPDLKVMVALDLSGSMAGDALAQAKTAIFTLAERLPPEAAVGVVGFGATTSLVQPFTTDRQAVIESVFPLGAIGGTSLYDGVVLSLDELAAAGGDGVLVVLSDGKDSTSVTDLDTVLGRIGRADVETSIVTLQTEDFDGAIADTIAEAGGGRVLSVGDATQLSDVFADVATGLGNLWEIRWRSKSSSASSTIQIGVAGRDDLELRMDYDHVAVVPFVPDIATETIVAGGGSNALGASWIPPVAALFVCLGIAGIVTISRSSDSSVERRTERTKSKQFEREKRRTMVSGVADALTEMSDSALTKKGRGRSLDDALDRAGLAVRSGELVAFTVAATIAALPVGFLLIGIPTGLVAVVFPWIGVKVVLAFLTARRRKKFVEQLADTLGLMAGSLTAGYGLGQTLDSVAREADSPTAEEFSRVVMETRLGRSLEEALDAMSRRIGAPDFDWVVDAIKIQASVGGNLSEIIAQVGDTIRARNRIRRQVAALTAEGKISALVLFALPLGLSGFIAMANPDYIKPLVETGTGFGMVAAAVTLMTLGGLWLRKLVNPEF